MKTFENLLVVMDKPKHPQTAFERAMNLHALTKAHVHLASFAHHPMADQPETFDTHQRSAIRKTIVSDRTEWLRGVVLDARATSENLTLETVWTKDIAAWVTEHAESGAFDLVVKSVHHSESLLHTPTDWLLLRDCPAPLLLVSGRAWRKKPVVLATQKGPPDGWWSCGRPPACVPYSATGYQGEQTYSRSFVSSGEKKKTKIRLCGLLQFPDHLKCIWNRSANTRNRPARPAFHEADGMGRQVRSSVEAGKGTMGKRYSGRISIRTVKEPPGPGAT